MNPPTWVGDLWVGAVVRRFEHGRELGVLWIVSSIDEERPADIHGNPYAWVDVVSFRSGKHRKRLLSYELVVMDESFQHDFLRPETERGAPRPGFVPKKKSKKSKKKRRKAEVS